MNKAKEVKRKIWLIKFTEFQYQIYEFNKVLETNKNIRIEIKDGKYEDKQTVYYLPKSNLEKGYFVHTSKGYITLTDLSQREKSIKEYHNHYIYCLHNILVFNSEQIRKIEEKNNEIKIQIKKYYDAYPNRKTTNHTPTKCNE